MRPGSGQRGREGDDTTRDGRADRSVSDKSVPTVVSCAFAACHRNRAGV